MIGSTIKELPLKIVSDFDQLINKLVKSFKLLFVISIIDKPSILTAKLSDFKREPKQRGQSETRITFSISVFTKLDFVS